MSLKGILYKKVIDYKKRMATENKEQELVDKAKCIIEENAISREEEVDILKKGDMNRIEGNLVDEGESLYGMGEKAFTLGGFSWVFKESEIVNVLIENNFDFKKSIGFLIEKKKEVEKEFAVQEEMAKIKKLNEKMRIREEAEKRVFGKARTKRLNFTEEEREMILNKFENKCVVCGKEEGLHIHHKDGNPENNRMDNILVLCGVCHKKIHMKVR
jgi:hypothetical protein